MSKENRQADEGAGPIAEVDRIRDIIFGPQMRLYEQQFKRIAGQLDQLGRQIEELRTALDRQGADQEARTLKLDEETQRRQAEMERALGAQIRQLEAGLEKQGADLSAQLRDQAAALRAESQELRAELGRAVDALSDDKASRSHVGDLLMEMGLRLKQQASIADLLGQLNKASGGQPEG